MIFASLTRDCEGSKRDQQLQPQLHCIHCVLQLYLLERANALQLSLYFRAHVASAAESMKPRENEVRERIPVPHDNYLESIISSRPHCKGYFCLLFP